jgi:hypothetical protein
MSEPGAVVRASQGESQRAKRSGPRSSAANHREIVLRELHEAGDRGVDNLTLVFKFHISQAPARVWELRKVGWVIDSVPNKDLGTVRYVLRGRKEFAKSLRSTGSADRSERQTGKPRPSPEPGCDLPLFDAEVQQ